jgi:type II secretory pathway pseudopilin PulG
MRMTRANIANSCSRQPRFGAALIVVIVAIAVMTGLAHSLSLTVVRRQQQFDRASERAQTRWLANSALVRARRLHERDAAWSGDAWNPTLPPGAFQSDQSATVVVDASPSDTPGLFQFSVDAELTFGRARKSRVKRLVTMTNENPADRQEKRP